MRYYYMIALHKEVENREVVNKGFVTENNGIPMVFLTSQMAIRVGNAVINALNECTFAHWSFTIEEGEVIG